MKTHILKLILAAALLCGAGATAGAEGKPLKVFILAGQSNMQGHAKISTMEAMRLNPETAAILKDLRSPDGTLRVCERVWISSIGSSDAERTGRLTAGFGADPNGGKIGPEFSFGVYMEKRVDGPILLIKTSWGGKSLNTDFRPPGGGPYEFNEAQIENIRKQGKDLEKLKAEKAQETGRYYRLMIEHVKSVLADPKRVCPEYDPKAGYELAGFVWLQGWNDMVDGSTYPLRGQPGGYDLYARLLAQFIRDVRNDLSAPKLPFVIGVMGVGGPTDRYAPDQRRYQATHQNFRDAMAAPAALPEFQGNVAAVLTEKCWDMELQALREREKSIKAKAEEIRAAMKQKKVGRDEGQKALDHLYAETFNPTELEILRDSVSNAEFHYLGSARIMTRIGKAFAEAMAGMLTPRD
jgi:hypothetical protein